MYKKTKKIEKILRLKKKIFIKKLIFYAIFNKF